MLDWIIFQCVDGAWNRKLMRFRSFEQFKFHHCNADDRVVVMDKTNDHSQPTDEAINAIYCSN